MAFTLGTGLAAAGGLASMLGGRSAAKSSKEMMRRQAQGIQAMNEQFRAAQPIYQDALSQLSRRVGLGGQTYNPDAQAREFGLGGRYGDRTDQLRFAGAQDDIDRLARQRSGQLQSTMANRGIASGSQAAALAANDRAALANLAQFRRGLAINAGQEQERRMGQLLGALNPALSMGQTGAAMAGAQGQYYGQQAQGQYDAIGQIIAQQQMMEAMKRYGQQPGGGYQWPAGDITGSQPWTPQPQPLRPWQPDVYGIGPSGNWWDQF